MSTKNLRVKEALIQRSKDAPLESIGYIKQPVRTKSGFRVDMLQTSMAEIRAIADTGNYPHKVVLRMWDGEEEVFERPFVEWGIGASCISVNVYRCGEHPLGVTVSGGDFGLAASRIGIGPRHVPARWVRNIQRWYYRAKHKLSVA